MSIDFVNEEKTDFNIKDLESYANGQFNLTAVLRWTGLAKEVSPKRHPKVVRDGLFADEIGSLPIACWEELSNLEENTPYKITNLAVRHYYGKRLATTKESEVTKIDRSI